MLSNPIHGLQGGPRIESTWCPISVAEIPSRPRDKSATPSALLKCLQRLTDAGLCHPKSVGGRSEPSFVNYSNEDTKLARELY